MNFRKKSLKGKRREEEIRLEMNNKIEGDMERENERENEIVCKRDKRRKRE